MMTQEEIAQRKEVLRQNPATARIAARFGMSLEQFLENIDKPGPVYDRSGGKTIEERLAALREVFVAKLARVRELREVRGAKRDGFTGDTLRQHDLKKKTLLGQDAW